MPIIPIFNIQTEIEFEKTALQVFKFQYEHVAIYKTYCDLLKVNPETVSKITDIPFLPVTFFKQEAIIAQGYVSEKIFTIIGTTGNTTSKHYVADINSIKLLLLIPLPKSFGTLKPTRT